MAAPDVFPVPRRSTPTGSAVPAGWRAREEPADDLPPEGYEIVADGSGVVLRAADEAGRRHGLGTLAQLAREGEPFPGVAIRDWPDFAVRGAMLDVSRDRVPTRATLDRLVGLLALARCNHLQLYVEHTFAHPGEEAVWGDASPLSGEDLRWLDERCAEVGIELSANQATFGHMERWLRTDAHRHRAECPDGFEVVPGLRLPPAVLAPTPENAAFAIGLVREQLRHVGSRRANIDCDETFELGRGASRAHADARGRGSLYVDHLLRIAGPLLADGCEVLFWSDVLRHDPELLHRLPDGLVPIAWHYEAPRPAEELPAVGEPLATVLRELGIDLASSGDGFGPHVAPLAETGRPFWVAPGTSSWNSLVGRIDNAVGNLLDAARTGLAAGAVGYLVTDWGDGGHLQPPSVSFGPLLLGGALSWCAETNADLDLPAVLDRSAFDDGAGVLGGALDRLGRLWARTGQRAVNASPLQAALLPHQALMTSGEPDLDATTWVVAEIDEVLDGLHRARPTAADGDAVVSELRWAARLGRVGAEQLRRRAGADVDADALADELDALAEEHARRWQDRSRPGGQPDSERHLRRGSRAVRGG